MGNNKKNRTRHYSYFSILGFLMFFACVIMLYRPASAENMYVDRTTLTIPEVGGTGTIRVYNAYSLKCRISEGIATFKIEDFRDGYFPVVMTAQREGKATITIDAYAGSAHINVQVALTIGKSSTKQKISSLKVTGTKPYKVGKSTVKISFMLAKTQKNVKVQILNADGKVVWKKTLASVKGGTKKTVSWKGVRTNGKKIPKGFYRVRVIAGNTRKYSAWMQWK